MLEHPLLCIFFSDVFERKKKNGERKKKDESYSIPSFPLPSSLGMNRLRKVVVVLDEDAK